MSQMKRMLEKMAEQGLESYIVSISTDQGNFHMQFWAEDAGHAGEQADDEVPYCDIEPIETQGEYEARTGETLNYGRLPNL